MKHFVIFTVLFCMLLLQGCHSPAQEADQPLESSYSEVPVESSYTEPVIASSASIMEDVNSSSSLAEISGLVSASLEESLPSSAVESKTSAVTEGKTPAITEGKELDVTTEDPPLTPEQMKEMEESEKKSKLRQYIKKSIPDTKRGGLSGTANGLLVEYMDKKEMEDALSKYDGELVEIEWLEVAVSEAEWDDMIQKLKALKEYPDTINNVLRKVGEPYIIVWITEEDAAITKKIEAFGYGDKVRIQEGCIMPFNTNAGG